jgi:hypothetical protein
MGGDNAVLKGYVRFEPAGDQFIGRLLCGLPLQSKLFASVSPHFHFDNNNVESTVKEME